MDTALVVVSAKPNLTHILHKTKKGDEEIWPEPAQEGIIEQLLDANYPRLQFPWSLYTFWRKGKEATNDQIDAIYGQAREHWTKKQATGDPLKLEFTPLNAIVRQFGDRRGAEHLTIRKPSSPYISARIPDEEYKNIVGLEYVADYPVLWLPKIAMDKKALEWYEKYEEDQAEIAAEQNVDDILREVISDFDFDDGRNFGEAA
jgi:hypothetical protein